MNSRVGNGKVKALMEILYCNGNVHTIDAKLNKKMDVMVRLEKKTQKETQSGRSRKVK